jgi:hypothetical protein
MQLDKHLFLVRTEEGREQEHFESILDADGLATEIYGLMMEDGYTVVLNKLYSFWRPVFEFTHLAEQFFEATTSANA